MPLTIRRKYKGEVTVYTREEADRLELSYVPWREAEADRWALTDDGYVAECRSRKTYTDADGRASTCFTFSFAQAWNPGTKELLFEPFFAAETYGGTTPTDWTEREAGKQRTRLVVVAYVQMVISKEGVDWKALGLIYRPDQEIPEATVRRLFKQERIQSMVREELKKIMADEGITEEEVVRMYRKAFDKAEETDNPSAMRAVAKDLADMLDMKPGKDEFPGGDLGPWEDFDWENAEELAAEELEQLDGGFDLLPE